MDYFKKRMYAKRFGMGYFDFCCASCDYKNRRGIKIKKKIRRWTRRVIKFEDKKLIREIL